MIGTPEYIIGNRKKFTFYTEPRPYQREALEKIFPLDGAGLWMGMGTGKTKTTIDLIVNRNHRRILVVCPKAVKDVWPEEFATHTNKKFEFVDIKGGNAGQANLLSRYKNYKGRLVVVMSYGTLWRQPLITHIKNFGFDLIVLDESHRIKSPSTKVSRCCATLHNKIPYRLALSGTMSADKVVDTYGQFKFMDQLIFGTNFENFKNEYLITDSYTGYKIIGFRNLERLSEKINSRVYYIGSDVVDLPDVSIKKYYADLAPNARKLYDKLNRDLVADYKSGKVTIDNILVKSGVLRRLASGIVKTDDGKVKIVDHTRISLLEDVLLDIDKKEPLVIFCVYKHDIEQVKKLMVKMKRSYSELSGSVNNLKQWQQGDTDVIIVQIQAGQEGISLVRARYCIYYSLGHSLTQFEQSKKRVHRHGQSRNVVYVHLIINNTIDRDIHKALAEKSRLTDVLIKGVEDAAETASKRENRSS